MRTTTKNYQGIDMKEEYRMAAVDLGLPSRQLVELPWVFLLKQSCSLEKKKFCTMKLLLAIYPNHWNYEFSSYIEWKLGWKYGWGNNGNC